jgi:transglutaminase-like putative cysteine protease
VRRFVALGLAAAVALSIPLFAIFPRVRNPMIGVRGVGTGTVIHAAGFTDDVTLDSIGAMRQNPEVAIRLRFEPGHGIDGELRLKGASFDTYVERRWLPADERSTMLTAQDGRIRLDGQPPEHWIDLWLQPMSTRALFLPVEAVAVEIATPVLAWDRAGALRLWRRPTGVLPYRVGVARRPVMIAVPPRPAEEPTLDTAEVTPRIAALAAEVTAGAASTGEAAVRLERHLMDSYTYADRFLGLSGDKPLEEFLFERREGHCELFASALVLMLRSEGIPARLVTGFLGGELNPLTGYYVVRQSNAHAWVEAYLPDEGWKILDPTPPAGRPDASSLQGWGLVQQAYDYMKFRWDRYILTYGFQDQVSFFWRLRGLFQAVKAWFKDDEVGAVADLRGSGSASETAPQDAPLLEEEDARGFAFRLSLGLLAVLLLGWMLWQHRRVRTATDAFQRLRHEASSHGVLVTEGTAPLTLVERLRRRYPEAGEPACDVVTLYLRESFGGRELAAEERLRLVTSLKTVRQALRRR